MDEEAAWLLLLSLAGRARAGKPVVGPCAVACDGDANPDAAVVLIDPEAPRGWRPIGDRAGPERSVWDLLDLYVPLCTGAASSQYVVGHLGQSLDGRIATSSGVSQFITGTEDLKHAHRMRALFDAVLVGAGTVEADDPRLTTRRVPGSHPARVVVDPNRRLGLDYGVFRDETAPTLLVCRAQAAGGARHHGAAAIVPVQDDLDGGLSTAGILAALRELGLQRIFIEGGGVTVSRFLREGALDRLQMAVAPMILGSGRPAVSLPVIETLDEALRFECRHFSAGSDVLFDCDLRAGIQRRS